MNAYPTLTIFPSGRLSDAYVITARTIEEAFRAAAALSVISGAKVSVTGVQD